MASLPAITQKTFEQDVQPSVKPPADFDKASSSSEDDEIHDSEEIKSQETYLPTDCLFCPLKLPDLSENITHMQSQHGLFIPEPSHVSHMETFIRFLGELITQYNECLYCGAERNSTTAIRQHMQSKGHCMLNLEREPELLEFWEFGDSDEEESRANNEGAETTARTWEARVATSTRLSDLEIQLPSGMVIGSRAQTPHSKPNLTSKRRSAIKAAHLKAIAAEPHNADANTPNPDPSTSAPAPTEDKRIITRRDERGLVGLPEQQRRALVTTQRKMQKREAVAEAAHRWVLDKVVNKQKYYRVSTGLPSGKCLADSVIA
jgi:pre-60S factor REI1